jgi:hypothetical protein
MYVEQPAVSSASQWCELTPVTTISAHELCCLPGHSLEQVACRLSIYRDTALHAASASE